ncbi:MAG: sulfatase-like hydrolase/transferase, partial [Verrucomicrobiota bacterium]|nr:sulfatase-like hydrolase/transferase [Verrucomicrobiota bacterium]
MIRLYPALFFGYLLILAQVAQAVEVGAYWAFQLEKQGASPTNATFTENVSVNTWPNGSPSFSYAGSRKWNFGNYGGNQTAFDGSSWISGRAFGWNANSGASTGNSFQITLDTTSIQDLYVKLRYRLNGIQTTSGQLVQGFSSFEYSVNGGAFAAVPGVSLSLANNTNYNNLWQADLSSVAAIEDSGSVTLRWALPNIAQGSSKQIRMDDLEVTALFDPITYTSSFTELLELRTSVGTYTPSTFTASPVAYNLSGVNAADFEISSSGELTFINAPVYSSQANYEIVVEMSDPSDSSRIEHETVSVTILPSAAITTRDRHHPIGEYNVLFIPVDDLRPLLNVYGEDDPLRPITINGESGTPNFDRLAASGVTFLNAHCQQAICTASRVSFLTGLRPDTTRNWNLETNFRDIMPNVVTLPQQFNLSGYKTYGVGKIFHGQTSSKQDDDHSTGADSWSEGWQNPSTGRFNFYERGDNNNVWNTWDKTAVADSSSVSATDVGEYKRDGVTKIEDSDYKDGRAAELAVEKIAEYAIDGT